MKRMILLGLVMMFLLSSFVSAEQVFTAVGDDGAVRWSEDVETWTSTSAGTRDLHDIAWSPELGLFVAASRFGYIQWSEDGKSWQAGGEAGTILHAVDWSPELGLFVAVGRDGDVRLSEDGKTWSSEQAFSEDLRGVAWSPELELFVAVGGWGIIRWSEDGESWSTASGGDGSLQDVAWSPELELFVAVGVSGTQVWHSEDGKSWSSGTAGSDGFFSVAWSPELELFTAVGTGGDARWTEDGETWTESGTPGSYHVYGIAWSPELELFVAVNSDGQAWRSGDGKFWTRSGTATGEELSAVAWKSPRPPMWITAKDIYTNVKQGISAISTFNATITNSTDTTTLSTTNGTIVWPYGDEDLLDINLESEKYFSKNYTDVNVTEFFEGELHSTELSLEVFNLDGSVQFSGWDYCINNTDHDISDCGNSGSSQVLDFNLTYGNYSLSVGGSNYPVQTRDITLSPLETRTESFNMSFNSTINLIDEATLEPFDVSETNETRVSIICDEVGQYRHTFTSSTESVEIPCIYNKLRFVVSYDDTAYTRTLLQDDLEPFTQDVYLLDLTTTQTIRNSFVVNDYVGIYKDPEIFFSKDIEGGRVTIHSDQLDTENKVTAYFIENDQYVMTLKSSNRDDLNLGFYGADVPGDKEITVTSANINLNRGKDLQDRVSVYAYTTSDDNYNTSMNLKVGYYDGQIKTESLDWRIEYINRSDEFSGRQLWDLGSLTGLDTEFVSFEQDISELINHTVYLVLIYDREDEDSKTYEVIIHEPSDDLIPGSMFEFYDSTEIQWAMIIFLSVMALSGTMVTQIYVNYFIIGFAAIMSTATFGLMSLSSLVVALSILLNIIYHLSTAEKSHDTIIRRMR